MLEPLLVKFNYAADWAACVAFTFEAAVATLGTVMATRRGGQAGLAVSAWGGLRRKRRRLRGRGAGDAAPRWR